MLRQGVTLGAGVAGRRERRALASNVLHVAEEEEKGGRERRALASNVLLSERRALASTSASTSNVLLSERRALASSRPRLHIGRSKL